ncbi:transporter [Bradyrhizobium diazoefficiens]|nr:transporter [Bradyrhizobium diazoefficiens]MBR0965857.1 transporter [Bradyrhizobium diazoefficiens]MBR0975846.1 transporter [Bradyrhizobium diazoefficiens]MBR1015134.1 transporter [Bradyrhizobium diazoefficiens]MBR1052807.1 transporter [Bradyrhizobium diazoefficiens]MBR1059131.1 transporter [Bradyrhizobium diazoefficiens]
MVFGIVLQRQWSLLGCVAILGAALCPGAAQAGACPSPQSEIATDRPDVTNSSLVVPAGSIQIENGLNTSGQSTAKGFDGSNNRLRFGLAPCLEVLVDVPSYVGRLTGTVDTGFTNVTPGVKWQVSGLPEPANLSVVFGVGLPTGTLAISGAGFQPYLQLPWSYELGGGWGISGMFTSFFRPSDLANHQTSEATFVIERKVTAKLALFAEYVGDYPSRGASTALLNVGGGYLLNRTEQLDFHLAFGLNRNSPDYIVGVGYSYRWDNVLGAPARPTLRH